ncbi:MAG TPA: hypothetical protein VFN49_05550 [Candidatus Aquilonibacter sp.]|nr:hypothetical protein [Candidatus Aquilonibacter sp.]
MRTRILFGILITATIVLSLSCAAYGKGSVRVQQPDGSVRVFPNARFTVVKRTLHITSGDKVGTLIVTDAACSLGSNDVLTCLPYAMVLVQNGTHPLDFQRGTIYYNRSKQPQTLSLSSMRLPPNGVMGLLISRRGTYVSFSGTLDGRY